MAASQCLVRRDHDPAAQTAQVEWSEGIQLPVARLRGHHLDEDDSVSLRHAIIALGLGVFFSLTPPLLDAYDELKAFVRKRHSRVGTGDDFPAADQPPGSPNSRIRDGRHSNSSEPTSTKNDEQT